MKKIKYITLFLLIGIGFTSCDDFLEEELRDYQEFVGDSYGILPITTDIVNGFYDVFNPTTTSVGFTVNVTESGGAKISSGEILVNFNGESNHVATTISSFPFTGTFPMSEMASLVGVDLGSIDVGDKFTFIYSLTDTNGNSTVSGGNFQVGVSVGCLSPLTGIAFTYNTDGGAGTTSGSGTMTEVGVNEFKVDDFSFGQRLAAFGCCPGASGVSFFDTCGKLEFNPNNNFDGNSAYTWSSISVTGDQLTIIWSETFTNGTTVLTRTDGLDWPDLFL
jgi:hypothetical protein